MLREGGFLRQLSFCILARFPGEHGEPDLQEVD